MLVLLGKRGRKTVQEVKTYGGANGRVHSRGFPGKAPVIVPKWWSSRTTPPAGWKLGCLEPSFLEEPPKLGGRFRYFLFFFCSGRGKGESEAPGRGGSIFFGNSQEGGGCPGGGGAEGPGRCLRRIGEFFGGGAKYFFRGRNVHQVSLPSDTELLLTKNYSKIIIFEKYESQA